MIKSEFSYLRI